MSTVLFVKVGFLLALLVAFVSQQWLKVRRKALASQEANTPPDYLREVRRAWEIKRGQRKREVAVTEFTRNLSVGIALFLGAILFLFYL